MSYKHLSLTDRHYIETERKMGTSLNKIAEALGRHQSMISREVARNSGERGYRHQQTDRKAQERHASKPKMIKMTEETKELISGYIEQDWSPEQIAGRLKDDGVISLHHETIYQPFSLTRRRGASYIDISVIRTRPIVSATAPLITVQAYLAGWILVNVQRRRITVPVLVTGRLTPSLVTTIRESSPHWTSA